MSRPLAGRTVVAVASVERAASIARFLRRAGAEVVPFPTVRIESAADLKRLDDALGSWGSYDWVVFTSTNGVHAVIARARALRLELTVRPPKVATVGPVTKAAAEAEGLIVDAMPDEFVTDAISDVLGMLAGRRVLLLRSSLARKSLAERLRQKGADVDEVDAYEARPFSPDLSRLPAAEDIDLVVFTSGSAVRNLVTMLSAKYLDTLRARAEAACIGPVTANAARACGFRVALVAREHTVLGLVHELQEVPFHG